MQILDRHWTKSGQTLDRYWTRGRGSGQGRASEFEAWPRSEGEGAEVSRASAAHRGEDPSRGVPRGHHAGPEGAGGRAPRKHVLHLSPALSRKAVHRGAARGASRGAFGGAGSGRVPTRCWSIRRARSAQAADVRLRPTRHSRTFEMRTPMQNTIHFVMHANGGIGKSF